MSSRAFGVSDEVYRRSNLTRRQLLMWIGQKLHPQGPDLNMANLYRLAGDLDPGHFAAAVQTLVDEADALRTVIREVDGVPRQGVLDAMAAEVEIVDLRSERDPDRALRSLVEARAARALPMDRRLFDFALYRLPEGTSAWYFNLHHIVGDGWTLTLVYKRLADIYSNLEAERPPSPSPLVPFAPYVDVERSYTESPEFAEDAAWWTSRVTSLSRPLDVYGRAVHGESGPAERTRLDLAAARTARLKALAESDGFRGRNLHAVLQNIFCTALCAWLHRVGPNEVVTVGLPFHNRGEDFRSTVGLFMQVLPVRVEIGADETFRSLFARVTGAVTEALRHRRYTVENPLRQRVCDVIMNYLLTEFGDFAGHPVRYEWVFARHTNVALSMQIHDFLKSGTLHVDLDMQTAAFPPARPSEHFLAVLDAFLDDPDRPLSAVDVVSPQEREELLALGRGPEGRPLAPAQLVPLRFEDQAARTPDAVAVVCEGRVATYRDLDRQANRIARRLLREGIAPDDRVGVYLDRGPEIIAAVLGILKAGAGYVPFDPSGPLRRTAWMLDDCRPTLTVTSSSLASRIDVPVVCVDDPALLEEADTAPSVKVESHHLAYVIYTSGSTGRPKGVEIPRRAMSAYLSAMLDQDWVAEGRALLAVSPLSFDFHVPQIHLPLIVGGTVVLATEDEARDPRRLISLIEAESVDCLAATPTTFRMLVEAGWEGSRGLRIHVGGEALTSDLVRNLLPRVAEIHNVYGPTETTVYSTVHRIESADAAIPEAPSPPRDNSLLGSLERPSAAPRLPVGRPIAGTQVYISDSTGQLAPRGLVGELRISGDGLARGYLRRPDLTAERFVEGPYGRAYATGDLARWLGDGTLEIVGRQDQQIKVRGHRIELAEIESELASHPLVAHAAVTAREHRPGDVRLAAYVVPACAGVSMNGLREWLRDRLPAPMIPASWVALERMPLSPNGKVDRLALPSPTDLPPPDPGPARRPVSPPDLLEHKLIQAFEEVLGRRPVDRHASFFELGGNSLLAVRLAVAIERGVGQSVPLSSILTDPTPAGLAAALRAQGLHPALDSLVPLQTAGSAAPFFSVHTFIGELCRSLVPHLPQGRPLYGLQPRGLDGRDDPLASIEAMAAWYVQRIRSVQPHGPYHLGGYCFGGVVAYEMACQLRAAGDEVALLAIIDAVPPRGTGGVARRLLNGGLRVAERAIEAIRAPQPLKRLREMGRRFSRRRRIVEGEGGLEVLRGLMAGLDAWPEAHQRIARVHYAALMRYRPGRFDGSILYIRSSERPQRWMLDDGAGGWRGLARAVEVHEVAAPHLGIVEEPHVREVADILDSALRRCAPGRFERAPAEGVERLRLEPA
jgi:enterobactin synthetase component F